ncbi:voltage-dependent anion-selective channel-like isoform X1 [Cydia amplana]|uniref:voltage-dependent anion-selective channel-like isoform X1 n=2 Tax=Cydia amplana TaxID=1869771 RepID=UPI002FE560A1
MSIFESLYSFVNSDSVFEWRWPKVSAVTYERKPCVREDGSMGEHVVCFDKGREVACPDGYDDDGGSDSHGGGFGIAFWSFSDSKMGSSPPPYYADLGKKANDVFGKGYHFGVFKLDLKTKSESGVEFTSGITSNQESGKVFGSLSSKFAVKDYGLTFTEKWNTDNTLATDITIQDKIAAGLKVTLEGTFAPQTGSKSGKLKSSFANETVAINTNVDLDLAGPIVDVAAVLKYQGWLAGAHTQFDSQKAKFAKNNFAFGYQTGDFNLHTNVDNGKDFGGSIYQKVSDKLDCGVSMKWSAGSADTLFGVGAKFALDADASLHAKINNKSLIGLGYQQKLRPGVTLTLSAAIDGQNFNAGGHKVGVALELEP